MTHAPRKVQDPVAAELRRMAGKMRAASREAASASWAGKHGYPVYERKHRNDERAITYHAAGLMLERRAARIERAGRKR